MNKILVCITIQENSKRLIDKGHEIATQNQGELHILHVRKGDTIFEHASNSSLFEELFIYGSHLGGQAHFLCSDNVSNSIAEFISNYEITHVVMGQAPCQSENKTVCDELTKLLSAINMYILDRKDFS